jgi:16S rRNA (guanine966-N2)-methyltransferase
VRIIAGQWRGRKLQVLSAHGLRPSSDRVRETLFNWLQAQLPGCHCLDLFAGSGALGFEALSRGAASALLIDQAAPVVMQLREHQQQLQAHSMQVVQADALHWLTAGHGSQPQTSPSTGFDLVFVDPPWQSHLQTQVLQQLVAGAWLADKALVYIELPARSELSLDPSLWLALKQKTIGDAKIMLLQYKKMTNQ